MPWEQTENEIRQRVRNPNDFRGDTFRRKKLAASAVRKVKVNFTITDAMAKGVAMILGKLKKDKVPEGHDADAMVLQSMRWVRKTDDHDGWTLAQAKKWWNASSFSKEEEAWPMLKSAVVETKQRMGLEVKSFPTEFKVDSVKRVVEGYASVFGVEDSWGDIVERGAFAKTLIERAGRIKACYQHDSFAPIGIPEVIEEDSKGLYTRTRISETTLGSDVLVLLNDKVISEMSFRYTPVKYTWEDRDPEGENLGRVRHLEEVILFEYSYVTWGANELSLVLGVKAQAELLPMLTQFRTLMAEIKDGGRTLTAQNVAMVQQAVKALQALLDASGVSTEPGQPTPTSAGVPGAAVVDSAGEPLRHSLAELTRAAGGLKAVVDGRRLRDSLRTFGQGLRKEV